MSDEMIRVYNNTHKEKLFITRGQALELFNIAFRSTFPEFIKALNSKGIKVRK